jgi:isoquinoline 1-oxidoreductase beta subunit
MLRTQVTRRDFVVATAATGGGMMIGFRPLSAQTSAPGAVEIDPWIVIGTDDTITLRFACSEMGQGVTTSLPMLLAEELECDWTKVRSERAAAARMFANPREYVSPFQGRSESSKTSASSSIRNYNGLLRQVGASARERLIAAAAKQWNVPASECIAEKSNVTHKPSGRQVSYGAIATAAATIRLDKEPKLKAPDQWRLLGTRVKALDTASKLNGSAQFGIDVRLPGMLFATAVSCPVFGGKLKSYDFNAVKDRPGVIAAVEVEDGLAVVADTFWRAKVALEQMNVQWDEGPNAAISSEGLTTERYRALAQPGPLAIVADDTSSALATAAKIIQADYDVPYLDHAAMEPMSCTAQVTNDRVEVWVGTMAAKQTIEEAANVAGVPAEKVVLHVMTLGGSFGRRDDAADHLWVRHAIQVAKAVNGRPVQLTWTREQDMTHGSYRPMGTTRLKAGLDSSGKPVGLYAHLVHGSYYIQHGRTKGTIDQVQPPSLWSYAAPATRQIEFTLKNTHVPMGDYRGVWLGPNIFASESFIDELAHAASQDPYLYRRVLLADKPDWLAVLDKVAERSGWGTPLPKGRGRGMAIYTQANSVFAQVAEVSVSRRGQLRLERIVAAIDCRYAVNALGIEAQVEGGIAYALTGALHAEITLKDGRVAQRNFDDYPMLRINEMPQIETHIVLSGGENWGGVGELGEPTTAPALCNAIFSATGKRVRSLPIRHHDLSWS